MASRTLTVALRAAVAGYTGPMRTAAGATGPLEASLMRVQRAGDGMARVGSSLTRRLTLPIVAVGAVATKMATDFDKSFTTMQTLAGVTGDEVAGLKDKVLGLAGETGRAPVELAEALYFLQSSGLDSSAAMAALEVSAKGAAAGLGPTEVIADAVSSAMLGYAESGLTAAEATDVLVATAREGKAEPAELAAQMGRLVPVASELGISFDQVGGSIAALSTKGFNAEQATTALSNVMSKLLKPSALAVGLLEDVGLSLESVQESVRERGLLATLEELRARLGESGFVRFLEDQQAVQGGLALLGGDLEATKGIMEAVAGSAGATDEAFGIWADSMGAKNAKAFADFQVALIKLGDAIAPIAADIAQFAATIADAFSSLPDPAQKAVVGLLLIGAAVGPLLSVAGKLATAFSTVSRILHTFVLPAGTVSGSFNTMGSSAGGATTATGKFGRAMRLAASPAGVFGAALVGAGIALHQYNEAQQQSNIQRLTRDFVAAGESAAAMEEVMRSAGKHGVTELIGVFEELAATNTEAAERFVDQAEAAGAASDVIDQMRGHLEANAAAQEQTAADTEAATGAFDEETGAIEETVSALQSYSDALQAQFDPVFGMVDALAANRDAQQGVIDAQTALNDAINEYGASSPEAAAAQVGLSDAQRAAAGSALDVYGATAALNEAIGDNPGLLDSSKAMLATWVEQGLITQATADAMAGQFDETAWRAIALGQTDPNVAVSASDRATPTLQSVEQHATNLDGRQVTLTVRVNEIRTRTFQALQGVFGGARARGGPVSGSKVYEVNEQGAPELMESGGRTFLLPGSDGRIIPASDFMSAAPAGGGRVGGGGPVVIDMRGAVIASDSQFERMVVGALARAGEHGRSVTYRGRRVA